MKPVLVLDANQRSALAVTRALGKKGIPVITADDSTSSLAGSSRFSSAYKQHVSPLKQPSDFIDDIKKICAENDIDTVFPMTELTSSLLLKHQDELQSVVLPFSAIETVQSLADKCQLIRLAESLDIPVPETSQFSAGQQPELDKLPYPLVIKPGLSWLETKQGWIHTNVQIADDIESARTILLEDIAFSSYAYMLQRCVPGHGEGVFAIYDRGKAIAFFAHRRLREKPPRGGVSVLSESVTPDPLLEKYARQILDHVKWHGVAMVEFRVDDTGNSYLMEVNTRFWGSLQLAIDAGVDFPWLLYQVANGNEPVVVEQYKTGTRLRWLLGDLDSLYLTLRDRDFSLSVKLHALLSFITPRPFITHHEVNRLSDIKPFFWELKQYLKDLRG